MLSFPLLHIRAQSQQHITSFIIFFFFPRTDLPKFSPMLGQ